MRFKIDENLPVEIAELLCKHGHDALTIFDQQMTGAPDPNVAKVCVDEQRALVTLDLDFSDIRTYPPHRYPGIVVLRPHSQDRKTVVSLMRRLVAVLASSEVLSGTLWLVQEDGIRIREGTG